MHAVVEVPGALGAIADVETREGAEEAVFSAVDALGAIDVAYVDRSCLNAAADVTRSVRSEVCQPKGGHRWP